MKSSPTTPAPHQAAVETQKAEPESPERECERISATLVAELRGEAASDMGELIARSRRLVDPELGGSSSCGAQLVQVLREASSCHPAMEPIAVGVVAGGGLTPGELTAQLLHASASCQAAWVEAVQASPRLSHPLLAAMDSVARTARDEETRRAAWLGLGTLGLTARRASQWAEVKEVERLLRGRLVRARGPEQAIAIEAAGNAGCESCEKTLLSLAREGSTTVRRAATSALRFLPSSQALEGMCQRLLRDSSVTVREQAAWSMRWAASSSQERVECLITAAATDASERVRLESAQSLAVLAPRSRQAESALVHLSGPDMDRSVRHVAYTALNELWSNRPLLDGALLNQSQEAPPSGVLP